MTTKLRSLGFCFADRRFFVLQECLEEKRRAKDVMTSSGNLSSVIAGLQDQLNSQKEIVKKYEGKIKKREAEVRILPFLILNEASSGALKR